MNEFELPVLATGITVLLGFLSTYFVSFLNGVLPFVKSSLAKKLVTVAVAIVLAGLVMLVYYAMTGEALPSWPVFFLIALMAISASYALLTKNSAKKVEAKVDSSVE